MAGMLCLYEADEVLCFFQFLDDLRDSGETNMLGSGPYLVKEFGLSKDRAKQIALLWMESYDPDVTCKRRAEVVYMMHGQP